MKPPIIFYFLATIFPLVFPVKKFIILHDNDIRGKFDEVSMSGTHCYDYMKAKNECIGGMIRTAAVIHEHRRLEAKGEIPKVLYFFAGGLYSGTAWFLAHRWRICKDFINIVNPNAMALGRTEFQYSIQTILGLVQNVECPIVLANVNLKKFPELDDKITSSHIFEFEDIKIGIVGYITHSANEHSGLGTRFVTNEIEAITKESQKLRKSGAKFIILVGYGSYYQDALIALECTEIDLIIGGGGNTLLYNGEAPKGSHLQVIDPYPKVMHNFFTNKPVPLVRVPGAATFIGRLNVTLSDEGKLVKWEGQPIFLSKDTPKDEEAVKKLEYYQAEIKKMETTTVGNTKVDLEGSTLCRQRECNFGNLITDALVEYVALYHSKKTSYWSSASIAFFNDGHITDEILYGNNTGQIKQMDVLDSLTLNDRIVTCEVKGETILKLLEHSADLMVEEQSGFLQVSGVHVEYELKNAHGSRVVSVQVLCTRCLAPEFKPLVRNETYGIVLPEYTVNGGDGYTQIGLMKKYTIINQTIPIVLAYLKRHHPIYPAVEKRISFSPITRSTGRCLDGSLNLMTVFFVAVFCIF